MENKSGIHPKGFTVLIAPEAVEETSKGGIVLQTITQQDREQMAQVYGKVIEIGPIAWNDEPYHRAKVGEKVIFRRYSGEQFEGSDGVKYRIINDKDIFATKD